MLKMGLIHYPHKYEAALEDKARFRTTGSVARSTMILLITPFIIGSIFLEIKVAR